MPIPPTTNNKALKAVRLPIIRSKSPENITRKVNTYITLNPMPVKTFPKKLRNPCVFLLFSNLLCLDILYQISKIHIYYKRFVDYIFLLKCSITFLAVVRPIPSPTNSSGTANAMSRREPFFFSRILAFSSPSPLIDIRERI